MGPFIGVNKTHSLSIHDPFITTVSSLSPTIGYTTPAVAPWLPLQRGATGHPWAPSPWATAGGGAGPILGHPKLGLLTAWSTDAIIDG